MLISERQLRSIVREMLNEQSLASGSGTPASGPITSSRKKGKGGYEYEIFSNGKIQIVSKGGKPLAAPKVLNQAQSVAVAKEQIALGNKGSIVARVASGELVFGGDAAAPASAAPAAPVVAAGAGPQKGVVLIGRQDFSPVAALSAEASAVATKLFGQGHGFAVVIDPATGVGHRFDFGRYDDAKGCKDDRWLTSAGVAIAKKFGFGKDPDPSKNKEPEDWFAGLGIHTMGVTLYYQGRVKAVVSPDGKITNLKQFCAGLKIPKKDGAGGTQIVAVPVNNATAALQFGLSKVKQCIPYAFPGAQGLTWQDTENCGTMAQKILMAGSPDMSVSIEAKTLVDTPDALYNTLVSSGNFQTCGF